MKLLPSAPQSVEENLALDEILLQQGEEVLRFWESDRPVVVVGRSGRIEDQVRVEACAADGVNILRRSSGGGAVVLAPGCLNYSLVFSFDLRPTWREVRRSFCEILKKIAIALDAEVCEPSDLACDGRKISGNAQRRTNASLLHHGTVLYAFDSELAERYLHPPQRQPAYRMGRSHREFLGRVSHSRETVCKRIAKQWNRE